MLKKIQSNPNFKCFVVYSITFIVYGGIISALGPLIPYFATFQHRIETDYSIIFFARAIGYLTMGIIMKTLQKYFNLHNLLIIGLIGGAINFSIFAYCQSMLWKCIFVCLGSMFCCILDIALNVSVLVAHSNNDQQFWLQLSHGAFGIGALIGPFIVFMLQINSYVFMGISLFLMFPFYYILRSPEVAKDVNIEQIMSQRYSQISNRHKNNQEQIQPVDHVQQVKKGHNTVGVPLSIQILICIAFFFYIGLQTAFGGWISSYTVLSQVSSKQEATSYSSIFYLSITIFRFVFAFVPGKVSSKLQLSFYICFGTLIISIIFIQLGNYYAAAMISSIVFGVGMAPLFPLLFTMPGQFGMELGVSQSSNICIYASLGQAVLSMLIGYLMGLFTPNMFFYGLLAINIGLYTTYKKLIQQFRQNQIQLDNNKGKGQASNQLKQNFIKK